MPEAVLCAESEDGRSAFGTGSLKNGTGEYLIAKRWTGRRQARARRGAIDTSQAVQDPVECFILELRRGGRGDCRDFNLCELSKVEKRTRPRFSLFGRPDLEPPSILPSLIALVFTGIGTNTLSTRPGDSLLRLQRMPEMRECGHYMMQPCGKIQSPRVLRSHWPIHTNGESCRIPSRPAVTLYKANVLLSQPMISPPHDICETPRPSSHTSNR